MFRKTKKKSVTLFDSNEFRAGFNNGAGQAAGAAVTSMLLAAVTASVVASIAYLESRKQASQDEGPELSETPAPQEAAPIPC